MQEMKPIKEGKVREIYDNGDSLIMVATDRISCFDVILNNEVTKKGAVLIQMSKFWFDMTEDIIPNHMISVDVKDMPEFFQQEKFDGNSMMCRKLEMLPIECIVRGYITGSGWESYKKTGKVCGIELPEGLKESDKLPEPIYTPSTKAEIVGGRESYVYRYEGKLNDIPNAAVILSYPKEAFGNPRALRVFKSTNAELSTQEILDTYSRRWPMELFFVKARENLHWINIKSSCFYKKWSIAGSRFRNDRVILCNFQYLLNYRRNKTEIAGTEFVFHKFCSCYFLM